MHYGVQLDTAGASTTHRTANAATTPTVKAKSQRTGVSRYLLFDMFGNRVKTLRQPR
jgi:hypothetical protein